MNLELSVDAKKELERLWMRHFPGLKPLEVRVTYSVAQYICAIKLQRAFRNFMAGKRNVLGKTKKGQKREEATYDAIFSKKGLEAEVRASQRKLSRLNE